MYPYLRKFLKTFEVFVNLNNITITSEGAYYYEKKFPVNEEYFGWTLDLGARMDF